MPPRRAAAPDSMATTPSSCTKLTGQRDKHRQNCAPTFWLSTRISSLPISTKKDESDWSRLQDELNRLGATDRVVSGAEPTERRGTVRQIEGDSLCHSESTSLGI